LEERKRRLEERKNELKERRERETKEELEVRIILSLLKGDIVHSIRLRRTKISWSSEGKKLRRKNWLLFRESNSCRLKDRNWTTKQAYRWPNRSIF
jgi:hypothetical protein